MAAKKEQAFVGLDGSIYKGIQREGLLTKLSILVVWVG